jgi:AcrR family transcriptional regulator
MMARKPPRNAATSSATGAAKPARERIIEAFMTLLVDKSIEEIGLADIGREAGVTLAELRQIFASPFAVLAAYIKEIDRQVLAAVNPEMAEESPRERLFDVLMRRLELLEPHKGAVRSLIRSARRSPILGFALNGIAVRSQQWMLAAAGINTAGTRGVLRAQGLAGLYASVLRTWMHDDDPGRARTMAALDRALARGQRWSSFLDDLCRIPQCLGRRRAPRYRDGDSDQPDTVAV